MFVDRPSCLVLRPWVSRVWAGTEPATAGPNLRWRERLVPSGGFHLVLRLDDSRIRIFDGPAGEEERTFTAVIAGARSRSHVRETAVGARSVGMLLRPGAAGVVLGMPAQDLAGRHTSLEDVWGLEARRLRERLCDTRSMARQIEVLEDWVAARLETRFAPHPAVREALARFGSEATRWEVGPVRRDTRVSHRRFVALFRRQVGLGPKQLCRVLRLRQALHLGATAGTSWAAIAAIAGYCDQSHLVRELRAIVGVSPTAWRALAKGNPNHVPLVNFVQARTAGPA